jgi:aspartyl-tRNA(Asn)/glutamyl-tRNA(Gln) amidotransferase subunit C
MSITREEIQHLADLSNFSLSDAQMGALGADIDRIVAYIGQLDELNTEGVEPTFQVFEMENVWRRDEVQGFEADREALLALTAEAVDHQIKVPKVL